jgi:hypothetical protein
MAIYLKQFGTYAPLDFPVHPPPEEKKQPRWLVWIKAKLFKIAETASMIG